MSAKTKERLFGVVVTMLTALLTFLTTQYFFSFETKANADRKRSDLKEVIFQELRELRKNQSSIICYLDKTKCL